MSTQKISSVEDLIEKLNTKTSNESYFEIMQSVDIDECDFDPYYKWSDEKYTRNCISKNDDYELLVVCWEKGQESPIHDFDSQEAWIHTIEGKLREEKFRKSSNGSGLEKVSSISLDVSEFSYVSEGVGIHRYSNIYENRSVSLNLYAKPITKWNVYNEQTGSSENQEVGYD